MALDITKIEEAVMAGLPNAREHIIDAQTNTDYYEGRGHQFIPRRQVEDESDFRDRPKDFFLLTQRITDLLCQYPYSQPPARKVENSPAADSWLQQVYRDNLLDPKLHKLDKLATLSDVSALQVAATGDPTRPLVSWLWSREEFEAFTSDDDPTKVEAVCTISRFDEQTTYTLYTPELVRTYRTKQLLPGQTAGGRVAQLVKSEPNPYACVPFALISYDYPVKSWCTPAPGTPLRLVNEILDRLVSECDDWVLKYGRPKWIGFNLVDHGPIIDRSGGIVNLSTKVAADGTGPQPDIKALQPELDIPGLWEHFRNRVNQLFVDLGIPASVARMEQAQVASGIALIVEQVPLLQRAIARQKLWSYHEEAIARLCLRVGGVYYQDPALWSASQDLKLTLNWAEPSLPVPDPTTAQLEADEVEQGLTSKLALLQKRKGLSTREQAIAYAKQLKVDQAEWESIFGPPEPPPSDPPAAAPDEPPPGPADDPAEGEDALS